MQTYILQRLLQLIITIFIVSLVVFFMVRLKGDPVSVMAPPTFSEEQVAQLRRAWGFDKPLWEQYVIFLRKAVTGDFGLSIQHRIPAMEIVVDRLRWTYLLAGVSALLGVDRCHSVRRPICPASQQPDRSAEYDVSNGGDGNAQLLAGADVDPDLLCLPAHPAGVWLRRTRWHHYARHNAGYGDGGAVITTNPLIDA